MNRRNVATIAILLLVPIVAFGLSTGIWWLGLVVVVASLVGSCVAAFAYERITG